MTTGLCLWHGGHWWPSKDPLEWLPLVPGNNPFLGKLWEVQDLSSDGLRSPGRRGHWKWSSCLPTGMGVFQQFNNGTTIIVHTSLILALVISYCLFHINLNRHTRISWQCFSANGRKPFQSHWSWKEDSSPHIPESQQRSGSRRSGSVGSVSPQNAGSPSYSEDFLWAGFVLSRLSQHKGVNAPGSSRLTINHLGIPQHRDALSQSFSPKSLKWFSFARVLLEPRPTTYSSRPGQGHVPIHLWEWGQSHPIT